MFYPVRVSEKIAISAIMLKEFEESGKHVLTTDHAYDPVYDYTEQSGRCCVQFMTFRNTPQARTVMQWWQERCIEWCYDRNEPGRFGLSLAWLQDSESPHSVAVSRLPHWRGRAETV